MNDSNGTIVLVVLIMMALVIGVTMLVIAMSQSEENLESSDELESNSKELNQSIYKKWDDDSIILLSFISRFFKSSNKEMISFLALALETSESTILRKISRLRGVMTGKSPYASENESKIVGEVYGMSIDDVVDYAYEDGAATRLGINLEAFSPILVSAKQTNH